jgi:hypothetical protein
VLLNSFSQAITVFTYLAKAYFPHSLVQVELEETWYGVGLKGGGIM